MSAVARLDRLGRDDTGQLRSRVAIYLDLENLLYGSDLRDGHGMAELSIALDALCHDRTIVGAVASCHNHIWPMVAFEAASLGVRVYKHRGGPDGADQDLINRIRFGLPATADTVVIGSGDHIFASTVLDLRARGLRVEILARQGHIAHELYRASSITHILEDKSHPASGYGAFMN